MLTDHDVATGKGTKYYSHDFMSNVLATLVAKLPKLKKMKNDVDSEKQP